MSNMATSRSLWSLMASRISTAYVDAIGDEVAYLLIFERCLLLLSRNCTLISPLLFPFKNNRYAISDAPCFLLRMSIYIDINVIMSFRWVNCFVIASYVFHQIFASLFKALLCHDNSQNVQTMFISYHWLDLLSNFQMHIAMLVLIFLHI